MTENTQATWSDDPYVAALPENRPFWQAAEEGQFLGKACKSCGKFHWYPREVCPFCHSTDTHWLPLSGRGEVYAFSTLRRASPPYTLAYVHLAEGPTILTNLVDMREDEMQIGANVQVVFRRTDDGRMAPKFTKEK